jgi:hypothetical protein
MKVFVPENLEVDKLLKRYPPKNIANFKKEHLLYIIHLITAIPATNKDLEIYEGFIPIYSKVLQNKVRNYRQYLDYLIDEAKVLVSNNQYKVGAHSKGYKFTATYSHRIVKPVTIYDRSLKAALKKQSVFSASIKKKYKHVIKWYNDNLEIDYSLAMSYIEEDLRRKLQNPKLRDYDKKSKQYKDPYHQYNCSQLNIERIAADEYLLSVDPNVFRLHSTISNLKSEIRHCMTYGGKKLVSIDIKNSQPYLSTSILKSSFWMRGRDSHISKYNRKYSSKKVVQATNPFNISHISKGITGNIFPNTSQYNSYIMLCKSEDKQDGSDLQRYATLVQQGVFYEYLAEEIGKELGVDYSDRKMVKAAVFQVLFTDNRFLGQKEAEPKRIFKDRFPTVYDLFAKIKRNDKTNLPRLLQRIESHLMLLVVAKRIARERPKLPILTIHDSIVTTVGNEDYVKSIMEEELGKAIGFPPKLSLEYWHPDNLKFNDGSLFYGEERIAV